MTCGIYAITAMVDGRIDKVYVGQSVSIKERWINHRWKLRKGISTNPIMQNVFNKYGEDCLSFTILEECERDKKTLAEREMHHFTILSGIYGDGAMMNIFKNEMTSRLGTPHSEETKRKISLANQGPRSDKQIAADRKLATCNIGRKLSPESIAKRTAKQTGIKRSEETKRRMREAMKNRPSMSEETKRKISETKKAKGQKPSSEHMEKLRQLAVGRPMSEKNKAALIAAKIGTKKPPEESERRNATRRANAKLRGKEW